MGNFELNVVKDANGQPQPPPSWDFTPNLIGGPLPFKMDVKVRDEKRAARIKHWYEESVADEENGKIQQY